MSAVVLLLVAGCGNDPVPIPARPVAAHDLRACRRFIADLPDAIGDRQWRLTVPAAPLGAAWGDPAIVLRCGVTVPKSFNRFATCEEANGVGWYVPDSQATDQSADVEMTAVGYRPIVTVTVPAEQRPEGPAAAMAALAAAVRKDLELVKPCH
jgi:hypothetical protein